MPPPSSGRTSNDDEFELRCEAATVTATLYEGTGYSNRFFGDLRRVENYLRDGTIERTRD